MFEAADENQKKSDQAGTETKEKDPSTSITTLKVPYVGKPSIQFARKLKKILSSVITDRIRVVYTTTKVKDQFRLKDTVDKQLLTNVVYSFKCLSDSGTQYIGYTNRTLKERIDEHLRGGTRVSDHIAQCNSCNSIGVNYDNFTVIKKCRNRWDTAVHEALLIKRFNPVLNVQLTKPGYTHQLRIFN